MYQSNAHIIFKQNRRISVLTDVDLDETDGDFGDTSFSAYISTTFQLSRQEKEFFGECIEIDIFDALKTPEIGGGQGSEVVQHVK